MRRKWEYGKKKEKKEKGGGGLMTVGFAKYLKQEIHLKGVGKKIDIEKTLLLHQDGGGLESARRQRAALPQHLHLGLVTWAEVPAALPLAQPA